MGNVKDHKKGYEDLYWPKSTSVVIDVLGMQFGGVDDKGDPNEQGREYTRAMEMLAESNSP